MIDLAAVILTKDEEANVGRCLEKLRWVPKVLVLDSGSTDGTERIAKSFPNVEWATRPFDSFAGQCNYALSRLKSEWVLSMDADYILSDEVIREISHLQPGPPVRILERFIAGKFLPVGRRVKIIRVIKRNFQPFRQGFPQRGLAASRHSHHQPDHLLGVSMAWLSPPCHPCD